MCFQQGVDNQQPVGGCRFPYFARCRSQVFSEFVHEASLVLRVKAIEGTFSSWTKDSPNSSSGGDVINKWKRLFITFVCHHVAFFCNFSSA